MCAIYHVGLNLAAWVSILTSMTLILMGTLLTAEMGLIARACDPAADAVALHASADSLTYAAATTVALKRQRSAPDAAAASGDFATAAAARAHDLQIPP